MTVAFAPSSSSIRATMPSSIAAAPTIMPERMHSTVLRPMVRLGASSCRPGSRAARWVRASMEMRMPGQMLPPIMAPFWSSTIRVVAVPR